MVVHFFLCHSVTYGATQSWVACQKRWRRRRLCICVGFVLPVFLIVGQTPGLIRSKLGTRIHLDPRNVLGKWRSSSRSTSKHCRREKGGADSLRTASNYINVCQQSMLNLYSTAPQNIQGCWQVTYDYVQWNNTVLMTLECLPTSSSSY